MARPNLNHWLLDQGIAVVSLYNSLENDELRAYIEAWCLAAVRHPFSLCVKDGKTMTRRPEEIVFKEAPSALFALRGGQVKKIASW